MRRTTRAGTTPFLLLVSHPQYPIQGDFWWLQTTPTSWKTPEVGLDDPSGLPNLNDSMRGRIVPLW